MTMFDTRIAGESLFTWAYGCHKLSIGVMEWDSDFEDDLSKLGTVKKKSLLGFRKRYELNTDKPLAESYEEFDNVIENYAHVINTAEDDGEVIEDIKMKMKVPRMPPYEGGLF